MAVDQAGQEADPVHECEGGVVGNAEAVAAGYDGLLQPDGRECVQGDVEAETNGVEASNEENNGSNGNFEGLDSYG